MSCLFDLVVFDWDGTLMDSESAIVSCMHEAIRELRFEPRSDGEIRGIIGLGLREAVHRLYPERRPTEHDRLADGYRSHFLSLSDTSQSLFPGVEETLEGLATAGVSLAVATGKSRRGLDKVLADTGLERYFLATRTADECHSKPHPQMLEEVMDLSGAEPDRTLMVGDSVHDIGMARNAGVAALAVSYGVQSRETLMAEGAFDCIDRIAGVSDHVRSGGQQAEAVE